MGEFEIEFSTGGRKMMRKKVAPGPRIDVVIDGQLDPAKVATILGDRPRRVICDVENARVYVQRQGDFRVVAASREYGQNVAAWLAQTNFGKDAEVGETFLGLATRKMTFGSFFLLGVGTLGTTFEGLLHFSLYPKTPFAVGDLVEVKIAEIDRMNRIALTTE